MNTTFISSQNTAHSSNQPVFQAYTSQFEIAVINLLDKAFGSDRVQKSSYKLRETCQKIDDLSYIIVQKDHQNQQIVVASIAYWSLNVAGVNALLLGPLAVDPTKQGEGFGQSLMSKTIKLAQKSAQQKAWKFIILIGDLDYYAKIGFKRVPIGSIDYPQPTDPRRILYYEFEKNSLQNLINEANLPLKLNQTECDD